MKDRRCDACTGGDFSPWVAKRTRERRACLSCGRQQTRPIVAAAPTSSAWQSVQSAENIVCVACGCDRFGKTRGRAGARRRDCNRCGWTWQEPTPASNTPASRDLIVSRAKRGKAAVAVGADGTVTTPNRASDTRAARKALRYDSHAGVAVTSNRHGTCSICSTTYAEGDTIWWQHNTRHVTCTTCVPIPRPVAS